MITTAQVNRVIWSKRVFSLKEHIVRDLMDNIKVVGLLQPPVMYPDGENADGTERFRLVIGRHRYEAVKRLYKQNGPNFRIRYGGQELIHGDIPWIHPNSIDPKLLLESEIAENVHRNSLTWQERTEALALLHKSAENEAIKKGEEAPTILSTARSLAGMTNTSPDAVRQRVSQSLILAEHLDDPDIANAESSRAAWRKLKEKSVAQLRAIEEQSVPAEEKDSSSTFHQLLFGDSRKLLTFLDPGTFDMILADPPYGIGADKYDNMKEHKYNDSWEYAKTVYEAICVEGFRVTKDRATMFLFCTPERWWDIRDMAQSAGWVTWHRPIIWQKSNEGMRPWGASGFAYTYESIMWAVKGGKGLVETHTDIFNIYRPKAHEREHAAAKPLELYAKLMRLSCIPGDRILDPCVGSGTSFRAGHLERIPVLGMENQEDVFKIAERNLTMRREDVETEERKVQQQLADTALSDL